MSFPLYLDEDVNRHLVGPLRRRGFDVLSTAEAGRANRAMPDDSQLDFATAQGRAILTHNIADFERLAKQWADARRSHSGIIVCEKREIWELAASVDQLQRDFPDGIANLTLRFPRPR